MNPTDNAQASIDNCTISDCYNYGVYSLKDTVVWINNSKVHGTEGQGLQITDRSIAFIRDCELWECESGIRVTNDAHIEVRDTIARNNKDQGVTSSEHGTTLLDGCTFFNNIRSGIRVDAQSTAHITNCSSYQNERGVSFATDAIGWVYNNTFVENEYGVSCLDNTVVHIENNRAERNKVTGFRIKITSGKATLKNNIASDNKNGITVNSPSDTRITGNEVVDSWGVGIATERGATPLIENTFVSNSGTYGLYIRDVSKPMVYNCTINGSGDADVWIGGASSPTFINTTYDTENVLFEDADSILAMGWWVAIYVLDLAGEAVEDADIIVKDALNETAFIGTTGPGGDIGSVALIVSLQDHSGVVSLTPHTFLAGKENTSGYVSQAITKNSLVEIELDRLESLQELLEEIFPSGLLPTPIEDLIVSFVSMENGTFLRGEVVLEITCGRFVDHVLFYVEEEKEERLLGEGLLVGTGVQLTFSFVWDTTNISNGEHVLIVEAKNSTLDLSKRNEVLVIVDNPAVGLGTAVASVAIGAVSMIGAAFVLGGGGVEEIAGEYAEERLFERGRKKRLGKGLQVLLLLASALLLAGCFTYLHLGIGGERITQLFINMLIGTGLVILAMEAMEAMAAKRHRVNASFSLWPTGL
ncbi:MAG: right-handed parallel beta-helix repeat-containing protein, partial [Thermoplasmata archaeon]|nr:right-handed parallel beta-helix repeat-containing protein [Thermoplasmata archaeon]